MNITCFSVNPFSENTYLLYTESGKAVVVDPGFFTEPEKQAFTDYLHKHHLQLEAIWLTHAHIDHVLGVQFVHDTYQVPIWMHQKELEVYTHMSPLASKMYGIPLSLPSPPTQFLEEGAILRLDDEVFEVVFTPGHAPGHIVFVHHASGTIINGDVLFKGSIGRTDFPNSNHQDLIDSIQHKLFTLPNHYKVLTGHGNPTTIGDEKQNNPFVKLV